jgi:hypothetical protein
MNQENDDFVALRRLLALKRHEQPPPGYYDRLAKSIHARLAAEQAREPWWSRLFTLWDIRPAWAGAFAVAVVGLYAVGVSLSGRPAASADPSTTWALGSFSSDAFRAESLMTGEPGWLKAGDNLAPTVWSLKSASNGEHTGEWVFPAGFSVSRP